MKFLVCSFWFNGFELQMIRKVYLNPLSIYYFPSLFFLYFGKFLFDFLVHCNGAAIEFPYFAEILVVVLATANGFILLCGACLQQFWVVR